MGRLSQESDERGDLLREIESDLDSDLGLDREEVEITREQQTTQRSRKLTPVNFAAYALGAAASLWILLKLWWLIKLVLVVGLIGWGILWWLGRKKH